MNAFFTTEKLIKSEYIPVDYSFDFKRMGPASTKATNDVRKLIGKETFAELEAFLQTDDFDTPNTDEKAQKKQAVEYLAGALYNKAMYHHFIWLMLRVSSNSVSVMKSQDEQTISKGQMIEAKESLLEFSYTATGDLVEHLSEYPDTFTTWIASEQYTQTQGLLFSGFRELGDYAGMAVHAVFFYNGRHILNEILLSQVKSRFGSVAELLTPTGDDAEPDSLLIADVKRAVAREWIARAATELPVDLMPETLRQSIDKEMYATKSSETDVREGVGARIAQLASIHWQKVDVRRAEVVQSETDADEYTSPEIEQTFDTNKKTAGFI